MTDKRHSVCFQETYGLVWKSLGKWTAPHWVIVVLIMVEGCGARMKKHRARAEEELFYMRSLSMMALICVGKAGASVAVGIRCYGDT